MKKIVTSFAFTLFMLCVVLHSYAQAPQLINYQGVARNGTTILLDTSINLEFTIYDSSANGPAIYQETQSGVQTNSYGIFTVQIGAGQRAINTPAFNTIPWGTNFKYLGVGLGVGSNTPTSLGPPIKLNSVPYALYANISDSATHVPQTTYTAGPGISISHDSIYNSSPAQIYTQGTGISIVNNVVSNTMDTVKLTGVGVTITGTYPNITITAVDLTPAGTIVAFGGTTITIPSGWLLCDGGSYSTTGRYANLFANIQYNFGGSGGSFYVPDFRGRFLRGTDAAGVNDPDYASRTAMNLGGNVAGNVGSVQADALENHVHYAQEGNAAVNVQEVQVAIPPSSTTGYYVSEIGAVQNNYNQTGNILPGVNISTAETRPKNAYVNYIIKY